MSDFTLNGTWEQAPSMPIGVGQFGYTYYNGKIYVFGGIADKDRSVKAGTQIYDIKSGTWSKGAPHPGEQTRSVWSCPCAEIGGKIYVVDSMEMGIYDTETDSWQIANSPFKSSTACISDNGKLYVLYTNMSSTYSFHVYDANSGVWSECSKMPIELVYHSIIKLQRKIYCIGGFISTHAQNNIISVYDIDLDTWDQYESGPDFIDPALVLYKDHILCLPGSKPEGSGFTTDSYAYDHANDLWTKLADAPEAKIRGGAVAIDDKIFYFGGLTYNTDTERMYSDKVYVFTPSDSGTLPESCCCCNKDTEFEAGMHRHQAQ